MNETDFHRLADATIGALCDTLEAADESGALDVECQNGIITIVAKSGKQWVVNKHAPTMQIWLSSPVSGGVHFTLREGEWELADGRRLKSVLANELYDLAGVKVVF